MVKTLPKLEFKGFLSFLLLHELKGSLLHGDALAAAIGKRRGEALTPGTIYPALKRLKEEGLIEQSIDGRRKNYTLTASGKKELRLLYRLFGTYFIGLKGKIPAEKNLPRKKTLRKPAQKLPGKKVKR